jgi:uncharacterized protein YegP (UPF0339 family)
MKFKRAMLEYRSGKTVGRRRATWGFRFKTADGVTLMKSTLPYASRRQAEQGFVAMLKSIATNDYSIHPSEIGDGHNN